MVHIQLPLPLEKLELSKIEASLTTNWLGRGANELWETIDSTNNRAKCLAGQGAAHGTIVVAEKQTSGRGRSERIWYSPAGGGLYISFLLRPKIEAAGLPVVTLVTGVAVVRAIQSCWGIKVGLKWVNDLIIDGKKVGGILAEYISKTNGSSEVFVNNGSHKVLNNIIEPALVIGIGLNLCRATQELPADLENKIGFLESFVTEQQLFDRNELVSCIANELETAIDQMQSDLPSLLDQWRAYSVTLGAEVLAQVGNESIIGQALDITDSGELIVKTIHGDISLAAGEISIRKPNGSYI